VPFVLKMSGANQSIRALTHNIPHATITAMSQVIHQTQLPGGQTIQLAQGDLTTEALDAIVNAANRYLQHGGGVAGAIVRRGSPQIQAESDAWVQTHGPVSHAEPAYTCAGSLPCRYVIHAVGPVWGEGQEDTKLSAAINGALQRVDELGLASLALPAISTGIFGFPKQRAAHLIFAAIRDYFPQHPDSSLQLVRVTILDQPALEVFSAAWEAEDWS
jgi:O-acetyl-ADP-ribose deacetylase (regulator of RNase III)